LSSMRRVEANRVNAQRSIGPKTAEGKARVAKNAVTHGLFSRQALLPDEAPQELEDLGEAVRAALKPEGAQEELLVDLMIDVLWRRRRLGRVEAGIYSWKECRILADRASREARMYERSELTAFSERLNPRLITDPEKHQQAVVAAEQMRARGNEPTATIGLTFIRAASALTTLSRYEASLERSTIGPSTRSNASNTPGSVATCHPRWPWTSRSVAPITEELTVPDRAAKHSRIRKGRPNPSAQLRTSCSADSAEQSHRGDESLPHFCETKPTRSPHSTTV
jgi:hypothetical protein